MAEEVNGTTATDDTFASTNGVAVHDEQIVETSQNVKPIEFNSVVEIVSQMEHMVVSDRDCNFAKCNGGTVDGNDSGVETGVTVTNAGALQRALSNNSAGYASSTGGLDAPIASCNSSLLSVCSGSYDGKTIGKGVNDCTSEGGSESSSISGAPTTKRQSTTKKRVALNDSPPKSVKRSDGATTKARARAASANRATSLRSSCAPSLATTERARSREKQSSANSSPKTPAQRSSSLRRPTKPDSLPNSFKDMASPSTQRATSLFRTPSVTRRTPNSTPSIEDGRWPSIGGSGSSRSSRGSLWTNASTPDSLVIKTKIGPIILENKSTADKYGTLPRRRKEKSVEDLRDKRSPRSSSITRDRMTSSAIVRKSSFKEQTNKGYPPRGRKAAARTLIFHEVSSQTAITSQDIDDAFAGNPKDIKISAITMTHKEVQVDIHDKEIERLEAMLRDVNKEKDTLQQNLAERKQELLGLEQQLTLEREEKCAIKKELQNNTERVASMLELIQPTPAIGESNADSLLLLESQIQQSSHILEKKQSEINELRQKYKELQTEMTRSMRMQESLLEERKCFEQETSELQDFLQDEKTAIVEALKDAEAETEQYKTRLEQKEQDVERLQDECRHLVRISEQRRQEYLGLQSKYTALESKSKDMVVQQSNAVSSATLALSDLGVRLNGLVDQLVSSYNISEQDLEDIIYHNEAYRISSDEPSPDGETKREHLLAARGDGPLSPQRHQSFITAVINAIKSAASTAKQSVNKRASIIGNDIESDTTEMLDSETEPCLMMENVLEDVSMPDSHSHNMVSSSNSLMMTAASAMNKEEESLHNLCEAIANRQKIEQQANLMLMQSHQISHNGCDDSSAPESIAEVPSLSEQSTVQAFVDHVISVDNLVTKLLKVLRIIQIDNDNCVQQLISEKNELQVNKEEMQEKLKDWEEANRKLKNDLNDASEQLLINCTELANSKIDLQKRRIEINKLNEDICSLSTLCAGNEPRSIGKEDIQKLLTRWKEGNDCPESELISCISSICREIPSFQEKFTNESKFDCSNSSPEVKHPNDAIGRVVETLNSIQSIVKQCPALVDLQRDLERMLPTDCNANAPGAETQSISSDPMLGQSIDLSV